MEQEIQRLVTCSQMRAQNPSMTLYEYNPAMQSVARELSGQPQARSYGSRGSTVSLVGPGTWSTTNDKILGAGGSVTTGATIQSGRSGSRNCTRSAGKTRPVEEVRR